MSVLEICKKIVENNPTIFKVILPALIVLGVTIIIFVLKR